VVFPEGTTAGLFKWAIEEIYCEMPAAKKKNNRYCMAATIANHWHGGICLCSRYDYSVLEMDKGA